MSGRGRGRGRGGGRGAAVAEPSPEILVAREVFKAAGLCEPPRCPGVKWDSFIEDEPGESVVARISQRPSIDSPVQSRILLIGSYPS